MALGLVSPLLNRGVRSRWLASLPVAGSKMLTIDSNGDTSFQDIPSASWGSITGTLSAQTDLQNALNAKLSLTGGTLTGGLYFSGAAGARLEMSSQQYTPGNVAINMPWGSGTLQGIYGSNGLVGFASAGFSYFEVNTSGLRLASTRSIAMGGTIASPEVFAFSGGSNTWEQRNSTNAQRFNLYGTYTDASNYRRLYVSSTTAGAFTIGVEGAGTGASGNTLTVPNAMSITNTLTMSGSGTQITGGQWWLYANGTAQFRVFNVNGYYGMSDLNTGGLSFGSGHGISWGSGSLNVPASGSITGDLFLYRNAAGQLDIRGDSGLRVRNVANTADASITAGAGTFNAAGVALTINNTADNPTISLLSGVIVSNFTGVGFGPNVTTSTCGRWSQASSSVNRGGIAFNGFTGTDSAVSPVNFAGYHGSTSPTSGALSFFAYKHNGTTSRQNLASTEIIADFYNGSNLAARLLANSTFQLYNTYTDASNYIRQSLSFTTYSSTVHAQLAAEGAGTGAVNVPFVITPRGTGAFILGPMPDGTATGGNARGQYAVDLQAVKTAASQVASGRYSFTVGYANTASGEGSGAGGYNTSATGFGAFSWGNGCTTSGQYGITLGQNLTASGYCSTAFGRANSATAQHTLALGYYTSAWVQGMIAFGSGTRYTNPNIGDQQGAILPMLGWSAGPAAIELLANAADRLTVPTRCAFGFTVEIFGVKNKAGQAAFFHRQGIIKNIAGTTSLTGTIQTVGTDINPASASVSITADDTNDSLKIECTQPTGEFTGAMGDSSTDIITLVGHPFINGDEVCFSSLTGGSGLAINTRYFVRDVSGNTFKLTTSFVGNTVIDFTTNITAATMDYIWYWHGIVKLSRINFGLY